MRLGIRSIMRRFYFSITGPFEAWYFRYQAKHRARKLLTCFTVPTWFLSHEEGKSILFSLPLIEQQHILAEAQRIIRGDFSLLGCHLEGWNRPGLFSTDLHNGYQWPLDFHHLVNKQPGDNNDIKFPWELSQFQFLPVLGQAYWLSGNEEIAVFAINLITRWLTENPYLFGVNWSCAMKVSIRACNWLWAEYFFKNSIAWTCEFSENFRQSLWLHGQYIERNMEDWGKFRQNHYLANVVGILTIGIMCPWFPEANRWKDFGVKQLLQCMQEQVYSDGMDFENSTSYHRLALEFFSYSAILCQNNKIDLTATFWNMLKKMFDYTLAYIRPDGVTPLLGDNDDGRLFILNNFTNWKPSDHRYLLDLGAAIFQESKYKVEKKKFSLEAWWLTGEKGQLIFKSLPVTPSVTVSQSFPEGGTYFLRNDDIYVMVSAANPGINGIGAHKHNDALHFEVCVGQQPVLTDSGTFCYSGDVAARNSFRATVAHNTIQVDGQDQNITDGLFSATTTNKAHVTVHEWETSIIADHLVVSHDGYARLPSPVIHQRSFQFDKLKNRLIVVDDISGSVVHNLVLHFHFAKGLDIQCIKQSPTEWEGFWGPVKVTLQSSLPVEMNYSTSYFSPAYLVSYERPMIELITKTGPNGFSGKWIFDFFHREALVYK